jgi:ABC-type sugar transport system permease subunit
MDCFTEYNHSDIITYGSPDFVTNSFSVLAYDYAYTKDHFGMAPAMATIMIIVVLLLTESVLKLAKWH